MNIEEYKTKLKKIIDDAEKQKRSLAIDYAKEHNKVRKGDIVEDHIGRILVDSMGIHMNKEPSCIYYGLELKKDGDPFKNKKRRAAYQINLLTTTEE